MLGRQQLQKGLWYVIMGNSLLVNTTATHIRVALLQNDRPVEVLIEPHNLQGVIGNIYRGRVTRVLPGMQAAFVDIGLSRAAFLYVDDAIEKVSLPEDVTQSLMQKVPKPMRALGYRDAPKAQIENILKTGQQIMVQIRKAAVDDKGARVTRQINLPGHYLVLLPTMSHIGISHRIKSVAQRQRLQQLLEDKAFASLGFVVRTAAAEAAEAAIVEEAHALVALWQQIQKRTQTPQHKHLLYAEPDVVTRAVRDWIDPNLDAIICDRAEDTQRLRAMAGALCDAQVSTHAGLGDLFAEHGVDEAIENALGRRVYLKKGGFLVFDQTEALTVVDVNSGRFVGQRDLEETATALNLEAANEIARQLRLRNIGGIIVIDFVDMSQAANRSRVWQALADALQPDKARTALVSMSEIGLLQMTRKRTRQSLAQVLQESCAYCNGQGRVKKAIASAQDALRQAAQMLAQHTVPALQIVVEPSVATYINTHEQETLGLLEKTYRSRIDCIGQAGMHREKFDLRVCESESTSDSRG